MTIKKIWRYVSEDSYGFIAILQLLQNIDDTFPWVKVTTGYIWRLFTIRISYFVGKWFKNWKELSVKVNYKIYFFTEEFINDNCDSMVFIKFYQCTNTVKSQVYLDVFLCKQIHRGLNSSWLYFGMLCLVLHLEFT